MSAMDPVHVRMYSNMIQIRDPQKRIQIIQTCLASMEYVTSAKRAGVYSYLLHYVSTVQHGGTPPSLPGEQGVSGVTSGAMISGSTSGSMSGSTSGTASGSTSAVTRQSYSQPHVPYPQAQSRSTQLTHHTDQTPLWKIVTDTSKQKAMTYFSSCLEVLGIQEEVALTDEALKAAYKRMALKSHPDKGGSEEYFEAVTRAYAYLSEILKHMRGGRRTETTVGANTSAASLHSQRDSEAKKWDHGEPVRLNAKNLDMNAFNTLFEKTHLPDPDSDGYGDWLKGTDARASGPSFKGEFNRDVFNRMFDDESKKSRQPSNQLIVHPGEMALSLNPNYGVDLVGERPATYTAAPQSKFQFTDLRGAYTSESTISDKVANVHVTDRNYEQYRASREKAPDPFSQTELHGIREFEQRQQQADELRERKRAEMHVRNQQYSDRMKQMVITDGVDQNQKKLTY